MSFEILCESYFSADEVDAIEQASKKLNLTTEDLIRRAVKFFASRCVPTQSDDGNKKSF